jgi:putative DNA primase/helicase
MKEADKSPVAGKQSRGFSKKSTGHYTSLPPSLEKIESALASIPSDDREVWLRVGMAVKAELNEGGFDLWDTWSQSSDAYREKEALTTWRSFKIGKVGIGTLFFVAKEHGWRWAGDRVELTPAQQAEREKARRAREIERASDAQKTATKQARAAAVAAIRWGQAVECSEHPYLTRKRVKAHGLRVGKWFKSVKDKTTDEWKTLVIENALLVPLRDEQGALWNLQAIFTEVCPALDRDKDFLNGKKAGLFHVLGEPSDTILIAEGYATAATVHEATGHQTFMALDCHNLFAIATMVRKWRPEAKIVLCADNDAHLVGNPGVTHARAAALAVGGLLSIPALPEGFAKADFNDLHVHRLALAEGGSHE